MFRISVWSVLALLLSACSWVALDPGAEDVLVLPQSRLTPECTSLGSVKVSVADRVGALERHAEEVTADLEILARNNAAQRGGDTIVPLGPASAGQREFGVYRCVSNGERPERTRDDGVEVLPYDGGRDGN